MAKASRKSIPVAASAALTVTATEAKTRFGPLLEAAIRGESVVITKHDAPKAVLISIAEFEALGGSRPPDLHALRGEFDGVLARLQTPPASTYWPEPTARVRAALVSSPLKPRSAATPSLRG